MITAARPPRPSSSCASGAKPFTLDELRAFLTGKLGKHEIPAAVDFVDELPRTPVGKLSRHELASCSNLCCRPPSRKTSLSQSVAIRN